MPPLPDQFSISAQPLRMRSMRFSPATSPATRTFQSPTQKSNCRCNSPLQSGGGGAAFGVGVCSAMIDRLVHARSAAKAQVDVLMRSSLAAQRARAHAVPASQLAEQTGTRGVAHVGG